MQEALAKKKKKTLKLNVSNLNRTLGTLFGAEITRKYYNTLEEDTFTLQCKGSGGQSFGAFIPKGLTLELEGDSNDYFGKGLSGGTLVVYPPRMRNSRQMKILLSVTLPCSVQPAVRRLLLVLLANGSASGTPVQRLS